MKKNQLIFIAKAVILLLSICSCSKQDSSANSFSLKDFSSVNIDKEEGSILSNDSLSFALPLSINYFQDSIAIVLEGNTNDKFLYIINTSGRQVAKAISKGNGANEAIDASRVHIKENKVICYDRSGKVLSVSIDPNTLEGKVKEITRMKASSSVFCPIANNEFIVEDEDGRFLHVDFSGKTIEKYGTFPIKQVASGIEPMNSVFPVSMKPSPDFTHIVCANQFWNKIEIYDNERKSTLILSGPEVDDSDIEKRELPFGHFYVTKPSYIVYQNACALTKGFMVGYVGLDRSKETGDPSILLRGYNRILTFDWQGVPKKVLNFDHYIKAHDFNEKTEELLCIIEINGENKIIKYNLSQMEDVL